MLGVAHAAQRVPPGRDRPDRRSGSRRRRSGSSSASTRTPARAAARSLKPASAWFDTIKLAGARGQAGEPGDPARDDLVVGLGRVGRGRPRPGQARGRVRRTSGRATTASAPGPSMAGPEIRPLSDRGPAHPPGRVSVHDSLGPHRNVPALEHRARHRRPRDRVHVAVREARAQERGQGQARRTCGRPSARSSATASAAAGRRTVGRSRASRRIAVDRARRHRRRAPSGSDRAQLPRLAGFRGGDRGATTSTYSNTPARLVEAEPGVPWLGHRSRGVAIEGMAPAAVFRIPAGALRHA